MSAHRKRTSCRICGGPRLRPFLDFGAMPLANSFLRSEEEFAGEQAFPMEMCFCEDCSLVQLRDVIDPEVLFRNYVYVTGTSETVREHNRRYAETVVKLLGLKPGDLVVEAASNDGSLLRCFQEYGVRTLGVEPAANIAEKARAAGVETVNEFFSLRLARQLKAHYGAARAVLANNVLAHVDSPVEFAGGAAHLLEGSGRFIAEVQYVGDLVSNLEYDIAYHEHLCYFSAATLVRLSEAAGMWVTGIERHPVQGGSLRLYAAPQRDRADHAPEALAFVREEEEAGLNRWECYEELARKAADHRAALRNLLERFHEEGKVVAGYGAPAKGNTLLNYCGIGPQLLPFTVDRNPLKVGSFTPGMHIPVLPVSAIEERRPDYVLILAWNFADEIMRQQTDYRIRGGKFVIPVPQPRIV